jgi:hypothetical protein
MSAEMLVEALPDSATLRKQVQSYITVAKWLTRITVRVSIDDQIVDALEKIVADDQMWNAFYEIVSSFWPKNGFPASVDNWGAQAEALAAKTGMDVATIMLIIEMAMKLIQVIRQRRQQPNPTPNPTPGPEVV